jgi:hypothetical protein
MMVIDDSDSNNNNSSDSDNKNYDDSNDRLTVYVFNNNYMTHCFLLDYYTFDTIIMLFSSYI